MDKKLNKVLNRRIVFDKFVQFEKMRKAGVPTPRVLSWYHREENYPGGIRWIGRLCSHERGVDIRGPFSTSGMWEEINTGRSDFGVQLIEKTREFRVHSFLGRSIHLCEKVPDSQAHRAEIAWGNDQCSWKFVTDRSEAWKQRIRKLAHKAVSSLGMDFGGVDIIEDKEENLYVLEVNSAPWLYENTLRAYSEAIEVWVRS
jgi:hypothetical protein